MGAEADDRLLSRGLGQLGSRGTATSRPAATPTCETTRNQAPERPSPRLRAAAGGVGVLLLFTVVTVLALLPKQGDTGGRDAPGDPLAVVTEYGVLVGRRETGVDRFFGIPYALPPTGHRRFLPAEPITQPWEEPKPVHSLQSDCLRQKKPNDAHSEDCLYLNVRFAVDPPCQASAGDLGEAPTPGSRWDGGGEGVLHGEGVAQATRSAETLSRPRRHTPLSSVRCLARRSKGQPRPTRRQICPSSSGCTAAASWGASRTRRTSPSMSSPATSLRCRSTTAWARLASWCTRSWCRPRGQTAG